MFSALTKVLLSVWLNVGVVVIGYLIVTSIIYGLYLRESGCDKWWLGCIPIIGNITKHTAGGVSLLVIIPLWYYSVFCLLIGPLFLQFVIAVILSVVCNVMFARNYVGASPAVYGLVPFAKYFIMIKEILECRSTSKVKSTPKKNSKKTSSQKAKKTQNQR